MYPALLLEGHAAVPVLVDFSSSDLYLFQCPLFNPSNFSLYNSSENVNLSSSVVKLSHFNVQSELQSVIFSSSSQTLFRLIFHSKCLTLFSSFRGHILLHLSSYVPASFLSQLQPIVSHCELTDDFTLPFPGEFQDQQCKIAISTTSLTLIQHDFSRIVLLLSDICSYYFQFSSSHYLVALTTTSHQSLSFTVYKDPLCEFVVTLSCRMALTKCPPPASSHSSSFVTPSPFLSIPFSSSLTPVQTPLRSSPKDSGSAFLLFLTYGTKLTKHTQRKRWNVFNLRHGNSTHYEWNSHIRYFSVDCKQKHLLWSKSRSSEKKSAVVCGVDMNLPSSLNVASSLRRTFRVLFIDRPAIYLTARSQSTFQNWFYGLQYLLSLDKQSAI
ncbi:hypothetical protein GEMRC1_006303 [Eukaryota sp. GEM-RC1]